MNSVTIAISAGSVVSNTVTQLSATASKGQTNLSLNLTGVSEVNYNVSNLSINWGDGTPIEYYTKDIVMNYLKTPITNEILYGKLGGSIASEYKHTYNTVANVAFADYTLNFKLYYENGYTSEYSQHLFVYPESFYDTLKDLNILTTQIAPTSDNFTVTNFEAADGRSFLSVLATEPLINTAIAYNISPPEITGNPWNGQTLSAVPGSWVGDPISYTYQWRINSINVVGAVNTTWVATNINDSTIIDIVVYALTEEGQSLPATSNTLIGIKAPLSASAPIVSGIPTNTNTLTTTYGTFSGSISIKTVQWYKNSIAISGATAPTFALSTISTAHNDLIYTIVTASNAAGTSTGQSNSLSVVAIPVYQSGGFASGTAVAGNDITASDPTWLNDPTSTLREWYKNGLNTGATGTVYNDTVANDMVYILFSASNIAGTSIKHQSNTILIEPIPVIQVVPTIFGTAYIGGILSSTPGVWTNGPYLYNYQWYNNGIALSGQTSSRLDIGTTNIVYGNIVTCKVIAHNNGGDSLPATSNALTILLPIFSDSGTSYYGISAIQGVNRYSIISIPSEDLVSTTYYGISAIQGVNRYSIVNLSSEDLVSTTYYGISAIQGINRYAEIDLFTSDLDSAIWYNLSAVRGNLN